MDEDFYIRNNHIALSLFCYLFYSCVSTANSPGAAEGLLEYVHVENLFME